MFVNNNSSASASIYSSTSSNFSNTTTVNSFFNTQKTLNLQKTVSDLTRKSSKNFKNIKTQASQLTNLTTFSKLLSRNNSFLNRNITIVQEKQEKKSQPIISSSHSSIIKNRNSFSSSSSGSSIYTLALENQNPEFDLYSNYSKLIEDFNEKKLDQKCTECIEFLEEQNRFIDEYPLNKLIEKLRQLQEKIISPSTDISTIKKLIENSDVEELLEKTNNFIKDLNGYKRLMKQNDSPLTEKHKIELVKLEAEVYAVSHLMFAQEPNNEQFDLDSKINKLKEKIPDFSKKYFDSRIQKFDLLLWGIIGKAKCSRKAIKKDRFIASFFLEKMDGILENAHLSGLNEHQQKNYRPTARTQKEYDNLITDMFALFDEGF